MAELLFDTSAVCSGSQLEYWADHVCRALTQLQINKFDHGGQGFRGKFSQKSFGQISIASALAQESEIELTRSGIAEATEELLLLHLQYKGKSHLRHAGREASLGAGDIEICDCTRPYKLRIYSEHQALHEMLLLKIPLATMSTRVANLSALRGGAIAGKSGLGALLSQFVINMWENRAGIDDGVAPQLGEQLLDLLSLAFNQGDQRNVDETSVRSGHLVRMKRYIDDHLSDSSLTPALVAEAASISPRYAYQLFESENQTIASYILGRRLNRCENMLTDIQFRHLSITEIAHMWGFKDASHFGHAFKRKYHMSPRAYRQSQG